MSIKSFQYQKLNQNFSGAARCAENHGSITIMKNNKPQFVLLTIEKILSMSLLGIINNLYTLVNQLSW